MKFVKGLSAFSIGIFMLAFWAFLHVPIKQQLLHIEESQIITDNNGLKMYEILSYNNEKCQEIAYSKMSPYFIKAIISAEDKNFFSHSGVDYGRTIKALHDNLISGQVVSGASTISQQLAKKLLNNKKRTYLNKLNETVLAMRLEKQFSKEKILELYSNRISFGGVLVGIESASYKYFGKSASNLDLAEASFLAGIPKSPTLYSNLEKAKNRQKEVLGKMEKDDFISENQYTSALNQKLNIINKEVLKAPHFVFYIKEALKKYTPKSKNIKTTLNLGLQEQIQHIAEKHLQVIGKTHNMSNFAILVFEAESGKIRVFLGSRDYFNEKIDGKVNILLSRRQVGSVLKPFLYLLAFMEKGWNANTTILDEPVAFTTSLSTPWEPKNYDLDFHGLVNIRTALSNSLNIPATKTLDIIGVDNFVSFLRQMGIEFDDNDYGLSMSLGTPDIRLLDLAHAYGVLARKGKDFEFQVFEETFYDDLITKCGTVQENSKIIEQKNCSTNSNASPKEVEQKNCSGVDCETESSNTNLKQAEQKDYSTKKATESQYKQIAPEAKVQEIVNIIQDNTARIDAFGENSVLDFPYPVAVKTGTTRNFKDNYTIGFTEKYVVLVWVGNADNSPMRNTSGITGAGPIFNKVIHVIHGNLDSNQEIKQNSDLERSVNSPLGDEQKSCSGVDCQTEPSNTNLEQVEQKSYSINKATEDAKNNNLRILYPLENSRFKLSSSSLSQQKIKLKSNQECTWLIDEKEIGTSKEIFWLPTRGKHTIKAIYSNQETQRTIFID